MHIFKKLAMLFTMAGIALGFATRASAQITWTLNDVTFNNGNTATGSFTTNAGVTAFESINVSVTGPDSAADFTATIGVDSYLPNLIGLGDSGFSEFLALFLSPNSLTNAGGIVPILGGGFDCPNSGPCGTLITNSDTELIGTTPEPATGGLMLLGLGLLMRKRIEQWGRKAAGTS
jgi:hypothetical protein